MHGRMPKRMGLGARASTEARVLRRCLGPVSEHNGKQALLSWSLAPAAGIRFLRPWQATGPIHRWTVCLFLHACIHAPGESPVHPLQPAPDGRPGKRAFVCLDHRCVETDTDGHWTLFSKMAQRMCALQYNFTTLWGSLRPSGGRASSVGSLGGRGPALFRLLF